MRGVEEAAGESVRVDSGSGSVLSASPDCAAAYASGSASGSEALTAAATPAAPTSYSTRSASRPANRRARRAIWLGAVLLLASMLAATGLGPVAIAPGTVARVLLAHLGGHAAPRVAPGIDTIVWLIRLPRVLLGALVGATLAMVGVALQAATGNRMVDPHLLGVSSGASLGAVAATVWFGAAFGWLTLSAFAFAGALGATALVILLGVRAGRLDSSRLLLSGVAVSFAMMALANLLIYLGDPRAAQSVLFWMLGGLGLARWSLLPVPVLCLVAGGLLLMGRRRELNALTSGDVAAAALGVDVSARRRELFVVCSLLTAAAVAVSGAIGFVGLVVPHVCRRLFGAEHGALLPMAALGGALALVWADVLARILIAPDDLPIGVITALIGGAMLVGLVRRG